MRQKIQNALSKMHEMLWMIIGVAVLILIAGVVLHMIWTAQWLLLAVSAIIVALLGFM